MPICWPPPRCAQRACGIQTGRQGENDGSLIEFLRHPLKVFAPWKWKTRVAYRKKLLQPDDVAHERAATQLFAITNGLELFFFFWKVPIDSSWKCYYITLIFSLSWLFHPLHHSWSYTLAAKEWVSVFYWSRNNIDSIAGRSDYRSSRTNVSIVVDDGIHSVSSLSLSTHFIQPTAHISECSPQFGSRSDVDAVSGCRQRIV